MFEMSIVWSFSLMSCFMEHLTLVTTDSFAPDLCAPLIFHHTWSIVINKTIRVKTSIVHLCYYESASHVRWRRHLGSGSQMSRYLRPRTVACAPLRPSIPFDLQTVNRPRSVFTKLPATVACRPPQLLFLRAAASCVCADLSAYWTQAAWYQCILISRSVKCVLFISAGLLISQRVHRI